MERSLNEEQIKVLMKGIVNAAVAHGIIKDPDSPLINDVAVFHLLDCLAEAPQPRKKIVMFKEGVIHPTGRCAFLTLVGAHPLTETNEVKTSIPVTPYTKDVNELTWFETINTIYIMAVGGQPVQDLRGNLNYTQAE